MRTPIFVQYSPVTSEIPEAVREYHVVCEMSHRTALHRAKAVEAMADFIAYHAFYKFFRRREYAEIMSAWCAVTGAEQFDGSYYLNYNSIARDTEKFLYVVKLFDELYHYYMV